MRTCGVVLWVWACRPTNGCLDGRGAVRESERLAREVAIAVNPHKPPRALRSLTEVSPPPPPTSNSTSTPARVTLEPPPHTLGPKSILAWGTCNLKPALSLRDGDGAAVVVQVRSTLAAGEGAFEAILRDASKRRRWAGYALSVFIDRARSRTQAGHSTQP